MEAVVSSNNYRESFVDIHSIRDAIEGMSKFNQIEVLRILTKHNVTINENKYGIHVNLSEIKKENLE